MWRCYDSQDGVEKCALASLLLDFDFRDFFAKLTRKRNSEMEATTLK